MTFRSGELRSVTGAWYSGSVFPFPQHTEASVTARNFKGQFSSWPTTAFLIFCGVLLLAMIND
ncbi:hypothetical protein GCM10009602_30580 [Nocardiopsis tropica]